MKLYLQFGHGMMGHCKALIKQWKSGTVVLSPRDLNEEQLLRFGQEITELGGRNLIDPQVYSNKSDHHQLTEHSYWQEHPKNSALSSNALRKMLSELISLNNKVGSNQIILPGRYCTNVDSGWAETQKDVVDVARTLSDKKMLATVCLSAGVLLDEIKIDLILQLIESWEVEGVYVVPERPNKSYFADEPLWLRNLLVFCSVLKANGKKVIVGYANHQLLALACAKVDAIASGTWLNVRSFATTKFDEPKSDSIARRGLWYYCPQTLSEYKMPFLDMAFKRNVLQALKPDPKLGSSYADVIFAGAHPSTTNYNEQNSFRHYLTCLRSQCLAATRKSFSETIELQRQILSTTEETIEFAHSNGVRGQDRDFGKIIDVNLAAIDAYNAERGFIMERMWD